MRISRVPLIALLTAHTLFVWGGIGVLGESWIRLPFCTVAKVEPLGFLLLGTWIAATLSPILGIIAAAKGRFINAYLCSVALTLFIYWLVQFLVEIRFTSCDSL